MRQVKKELADRLQLPSDLSLGEVVLSVSGRQLLTVENFQGILAYTSQNVVIQAKHSRVTVLGEGLLIAYYTATEMQITGTIQEIYYS